MKRYLVLVVFFCVLTACAASTRPLTHPSAQSLSAGQVAMLLAPRFDGTTRSLTTMVRPRLPNAAWWPAGPFRKDESFYTEAIVAPGSYDVAVACMGARWSQVFTVDVDVAAGKVYRFSCEVIPIDANRVAAKVVVSEEGATNELGTLKERAEKGDAQAQYHLGLMYAEGKGMARDEAEAVHWYRKAAEQGFAPAQNDLGSMYARGRGVKQDYAEALRWYRKAAEQGEPQAQNSIGFMYQVGQGVERDDSEAVRWYHKAAEQGFGMAHSNLGVMYDLGKGVSRDAVEAYYWFALAATVEAPKPVHDQAVKYRDRIAAQLTHAQISEAQKRVEAWLKAHLARKPTAAN